jgi:DNA uptake protein ComE-like DNA-binding protein
MPIYKIDMPPVMGASGKFLFDEIDLTEAQAATLIEQKVISLKGAKTASPPLPPAVEETASTLVDTELLEFFNNATVEDLSSLKNIGEVKAKKIKSKAPYKSLVDVQAQAGLTNQGWADALADLTI